MHLPSLLLAMASAWLLPPCLKASAAELNALTPQEQAGGWKLLFDGRSTAGWHTYGKRQVSAGSWQIRDGCLVLPDGNGRPNGTGGDLVTDAMFTNFEFTFEWRVGTGGNSGVEYLFTEGERRTATFYQGDTGDSPLGFEYQVLDDAPHAKNAEDRLAASIYSLVKATGKGLRPVGEFNQGRIVVDGSRVEHWLNGRKVAECELGSPTLERIIAGSKYKYYPGVGVKRATAIALQDHGAGVAYRNLKLRELQARPSHPVPSAAAAAAAAALTQVPTPVPSASMQAADWRVWCWSKTDNRWVEHSLEKMSVQIKDGVLTARNTTQDGWQRAILLYRRVRMEGDFIVAAEYRGQTESFDLQSAQGDAQRLTCANVSQGDTWRTLMLSRWQGQQKAWVDETQLPLTGRRTCKHERLLLL